jgi:clan AA aspartic protease (TIGR02281 family)
MPQPAAAATGAGEDSVGIVANERGALIRVDLGSHYTLMMIDTGATMMTVTDSVAKQLIDANEATSGQNKTYVLANGQSSTTKSIVIATVQLGSHKLHNVAAAVVTDGALMLLPFPVLNLMGKFTIDTANSKLVFGS